MEDLSSEISQKMRSAVKAKLHELGGTIDDELPDYVMIMVANKRSKQQMITDLTLFLDSQTELFVTWLHEVLTKLQEVTVQPALTPKKRKETKKKEKKKIADVVAETVIKNNQQVEVDADAAKKEERSDTPPLPTITEMVVHHQKQKAVETNQKQKELAEIQKKIMETKKKIQEMDETEEPMEVELPPPKKSIAERIGTKESKRKNKREDRELYVPSSRRGDRKLGSRVIKAPPKVEVASDGENNDKTVSSIIKVKPRPKLSPTRQASKNLLLKAMADAQKSAVQATKDSLKRRLKSRSPSPAMNLRGQKLYTKSYRDRMNRDAMIRRHVGKTKDNIVVHVKGTGTTKEEYIPEPVSDKNDDSDNDYIYIPQQIEAKEESLESFENDYDMEQKSETKTTQFVVTLDDSEEFKAKFKNRLGSRNGTENKNALFRKVSSPPNDNDRQSPIVTRQEYQEKYLKQKEIKKIIIRNDSEDDDASSPRKVKDRNRSCHTTEESDDQGLATRSRSREAESHISPKPPKRKRSPITFDLKQDDDIKRKRSRSRDKDHQIISIRKSNEFRKFDNVPDFLTQMPIDKKPKERCKFYPACTKFECEFFHPISNCKAFPNCKFADKCLYIHPKCKYDLSCTNNSCNYSHTRISTSAPPLSSHVIPVQNYKSINPLRSTGGGKGNVDSTMMCKYYPHCANNSCNFYHPKPCKYGWNCLNKTECNFYHADVVQVRDKFKWVASAV